jgi:hypothetical protein
MNYRISFQERAAIASIRLSRQLPITLAKAKGQALWLKKNSETKHKKTQS